MIRYFRQAIKVNAILSLKGTYLITFPWTFVKVVFDVKLGFQNKRLQTLKIFTDGRTRSKSLQTLIKKSFLKPIKTTLKRLRTYKNVLLYSYKKILSLPEQRFCVATVLRFRTRNIPLTFDTSVVAFNRVFWKRFQDCEKITCCSLVSLNVWQKWKLLSKSIFGLRVIEWTQPVN